MNNQCLERYQQTPCYPCEQYRNNQGNPGCDLGIPSFPLIRCMHYDCIEDKDDVELEVSDENKKN